MATPAEVIVALERLAADAQHRALGNLSFAGSTLGLLTDLIRFTAEDDASIAVTTDRLQDSAEWAAARQAGWQHLTSAPEGATADFGPRELADRIVTFLEGSGSGLAKTLYTAEERATMRSFAGAMRTLTPQRVSGASASPSGAPAPMIERALETVAKHESKINRLLTGIGLVKGGIPGAVAAHGVARAAHGIASAAQARRALQRAQEAVSGAPVVAPPAPPQPVQPAPALPNYGAPIGALIDDRLRGYD